MIRVEYHAQLNTKPTIFKFYTPWEFFVGLLITFSTVGLPIVLGMPPSFLDAALTFVGYTVFLVYFKLGKPDGYLAHLLRHVFTPINFRPGHKVASYPVRPAVVGYVKEVARTPQQLWQACQQHQIRLLDAGLVPNGSCGGYLAVTDPDMKARARAFIDAGGVLSVGPSFIPPETTSAP